jgi:lipoprotein-anchoring transpeptidase ErfK/SrfK
MERQKCSIRWLENLAKVRFEAGAGPTGFRHRKCSPGRPDLPRFMPGGLDNPLGARALYLGSTLYRIHGSNEPETIGQAVMTNDDVIDLYNRVSVGATVIVR